MHKALTTHVRMHAGHYPNSGDLKTDAMHLFYIYLLYERGKRFKYSTSRYSMRMVFAVLLLYFIDVTHAMDNADGSSGPRCGVFEGTAAAFAQWVITFKAWIAWKRPELIALMNGKRRPRPVRNPAGAIVNTDDRDEWDIRNTQLYGAIVSFVHTPIQASLHVVADGRGTKALKYLSNTFGSQTVGDRAEATARLQKSYFDQRAKMNEADVIRQFNEMSLARADIISAGGAAIDDELLISLFENSLPISYSHIRQMVRYAKHRRFQAYYDDLLSQVKAELRSSQRDSVGAFYTGTIDPNDLKPPKGKGKGKGKGAGKGKGKGKGKTSWSRPMPCFNCLSHDHGVVNCPESRVTCAHCGGQHNSALCPSKHSVDPRMQV